MQRALWNLSLVPALAAFLLPATPAGAARPVDWQMGLQPAVTGVMEDIAWFNTYTLVIITIISVFVMALLAVCLVKFRRSVNAQPSRLTHNTALEVLWTVVPVLILVAIAIPSFRILYDQLDIPEYDMTVKAIGYQWYWGYEFTDEGLQDISFDSIMLDDAARAQRADAHDLPPGALPRLLAVDNELVVPVGATVRLLVTAADVLHAFAMPAFGVKIDAVPGRLNETWFRAEREGVYYGQCSEICGKNHAFMPIVIRVVPQDEFDVWAALAREDVDAAQQQLMARAHNVPDGQKMKLAAHPALPGHIIQ